MINLSLARIMYGTSEDFRAASSTSATALLSSRAAGGKGGKEAGAAPGAFSSFLHKAWAALHHKD